MNKNVFEIDYGYILHKCKQFGVMNFSWVIWGALLMVALLYLLRHKASYQEQETRMEENGKRALFGAVGGMTAFVLFSLFYVTASLYRYNTLFSLILSLIYVVVLARAVRGKWKWLLAGATSVLFLGQSFLDLDPVAGRVFTVLDTGERKKIFNTYDSTYYGDGLVNNYHYAWIDKLLDAMLEDVDYSENMDMVFPGLGGACVHIDHTGWDQKQKKRVIYDQKVLEENPQIVPTTMVRTDDLMGKLPWKYEGFRYDTYKGLRREAVVLFLPYFEEDISYHLTNLKQYYYIGEGNSVKNAGGSLSYYKLYKKECYEGFCLSDFIQGEYTPVRTAGDCTFPEYLYRELENGPFPEGRDYIDFGDDISFSFEAYTREGALSRAEREMYYGKINHVVIGSGRTEGDFEESLVGRDKHGTVRYEWDVPADYLPAGKYAGETIVFEIKIEWINGHKSIENISDEEMKEYMQKYSAKQQESLREAERMECIEALNAGKTVVTDEQQVKRHEGLIASYMENYRKEMGISLEEFLENYLKCTREEYFGALKKMAEAAAAME